MPRVPPSADELAALVRESAAACLRAGPLDEDRYWTRVGPGAGTAAAVRRTPADLAAARADSRWLLEGYPQGGGANCFAIGAAENRANYAVGTGLVYTAAAAPGRTPAPGLVAEVQAFIDAFAEINALPDMEWEAVWRLDRDGDAFVRLFGDPADVPEARFVDPECVRCPDAGVGDDPAAADREWGVEHAPGDRTQVVAYWVTDDADADADPERVPEAEIVHAKLNTTSAHVCGWPTFVPAAAPLCRAAEVLIALTATTTVRAKIALIETIPGFTRERAEEIAGRLTQARPPDADPRRPVESVEHLPYGTHLRVREGVQFQFPALGGSAGEGVEVIQANLREAGQRMTMPEWMFTGVANATYANSFVSESPSLKAFERLQRLLVGKFGTGRLKGQASLVWRAVRRAVAGGLLPEAALSDVRVTATAPSLLVRDKGAEAGAYKTLIDAHVLPVRKVQQELGYDPDELAKLAKLDPSPASAGRTGKPAPEPTPPASSGAGPAPDDAAPPVALGPAAGTAVAEAEVRGYIAGCLAAGVRPADWDADAVGLADLYRALEAKRDLSKLVKIQKADSRGVTRTYYVRHAHPQAGTHAVAVGPAAGGPALRPDGTPAAPKSEDVHTVRPAALSTDPARFQYKVSGIRADGVSDELRGVRAWNPELGGALLAWRDPADGKDYVVNGHHRLELATRLGAKSINVRYIDAKDAVEARSRGALANIAEGRGTATDAAKYLRDSGRTAGDLSAAGVSLSGKVAADAQALTALSPEAFQRVADGRLDETQAVAVGRHLPDHALQRVLFQKLAGREEAGKDWSTKEVERAAQKMAAAGKTATPGEDLFGQFTDERSTFDQEVEVEAATRRALAEAAGNYRAVASEKRAGAVADAGNTLNTGENRRRRDAADQHLAVFDRVVDLKGPVSAAVKAAAADLARAVSKAAKDAAKRQGVAAVRAAVELEHRGAARA